ncbi:MAG: radical SAM protein [Halobacteriota archaeon]|nr:radical SAM protein [Halobacteriota archaeon]
MKVSYIALSEKRCTVQFHGCNFRCKGCFTLEKSRRYTEITPEELSKRIEKLDVEEVMLAGGEPTLYREDLLEFTKLCDSKTILTTNGHLLDDLFIRSLEESGIVKVHIDLKAYSSDLHEWYTGSSNQDVFRAIELLSGTDMDLEVVSVLIPDIIDIEEIEKIAEFLSNICDIRYRIIRYVPVGGLSRRPTEDEIREAVSTAKRYLSNVTSSLEWRRHPMKREVDWLGEG